MAKQIIAATAEINSGYGSADMVEIRCAVGTPYTVHGGGYLRNQTHGMDLGRVMRKIERDARFIRWTFWHGMGEA